MIDQEEVMTKPGLPGSDCARATLHCPVMCYAILNTRVRLQEYFLRKKGFFKFSNKDFRFKVPGSDCARTSPHYPMLCHYRPTERTVCAAWRGVQSRDPLQGVPCAACSIRHTCAVSREYTTSGVEALHWRVVCSVQCAVFGA